MIWAVVGIFGAFISWLGMRWSERRRIRKILRDDYIDGEIQRRKDLARSISTPGGQDCAAFPDEESARRAKSRRGVNIGL